MACLRWLLVRAWECHVFICVEVKNGVDSNSFTKKELMMIIFVIIIYCNYFWHYNSFLNFYGQHNNFYIYVFLYRYDNLKFIFLNLFILFHFIGKLLFVISLFLLVLYIFNISLFVCLFGALQGDSVWIFFFVFTAFPLGNFYVKSLCRTPKVLSLSIMSQSPNRHVKFFIVFFLAAVRDTASSS